MCCSFRTFTEMPNENYMVLTKLLLGHASDDIPRANEIRTIVKDIWDIRMSKIRSSVNKLISNMDLYADVSNLTVMEINSIRPILPHALDQIYRMKTVSTVSYCNLFFKFFLVFRHENLKPVKAKVPPLFYQLQGNLLHFLLQIINF